MTPYLGEIKLLPWDWAPKGWALCDGRLLPLSQYQALFALLGTTYGGDGRTTFGLPDLRGRVAIHRSAQHPLGAPDGAEQVTLTIATMPGHFHPMVGTSTTATAYETPNHAFANETSPQFYAADSNPLVTIAPATVGPTGSGQPHPNVQPSLVLTYCIALAGIFPSRN